MNVGDVALHDYLRSMEEGVSRRRIISWACDPLMNEWLTTGWGDECPHHLYPDIVFFDGQSCQSCL